MDETFEVNLLRNVQPTDRKLSVSKEFVGPKDREEKSRRDPHDHRGRETAEKPVKTYGKDPGKPADEDLRPGKIDITI
ncbi:MAG: hypothetical protein PHC90_06560 [Syntrophorhabdaceae bacterium]|nr:hypothetical protein [Syntrophorhabdaceae bacterium]